MESQRLIKCWEVCGLALGLRPAVKKWIWEWPQGLLKAEGAALWLHAEATLFIPASLSHDARKGPCLTDSLHPVETRGGALSSQYKEPEVGKGTEESINPLQEMASVSAAVPHQQCTVPLRFPTPRP